jgi:hypothetical protein
MASVGRARLPQDEKIDHDSMRRNGGNCTNLTLPPT